ncbi:MAG TPA: hypothetical protein PLP23_18805 [Panacibacter sp.]|nr:hypothetical protein [Panacibacter sp.]
MPDTFYMLFFFGIIYLIEFGIVYLSTRKSFPKRSLQLNAGAWLLLMMITYYSGALGGLFSVLLMIVLLLVLRKPSQVKDFQQFYAENKIYTSKKISHAVADILGNRNWTYAEGTLNKNAGETINYFFWQGYTSSYVTTGKFTHTTAYTHYLAFIFPPGTVSNVFKQHALAAADKSHYTLKEKIKFFFIPDTDTPCLVTTAADGSFIVEYVTTPDVEHYAKRLSWIKENITKLYYPVTEFAFAN